MKEEEIFNKVGDIIRELSEQYKYLSKNKSSHIDLELELFVANADFLADHIKIIQKLRKNSKPASAPSNARPEPVEEPIAEKPETKIEAAPEPEEKRVDPPSEEKPEVEENDTAAEIKFDFGKDAEAEIEAEPKADKPVFEPQPVVREVVIREKTVSLDTTSTHIPTVNDLLSDQSEQTTLGAQYNKQPATDLKAIISLNDKLLFVKDLFNGYSLAYSEAVELLNRFDNFEAADNFLKNNYSGKNNWADKQGTVDKFYEVLNRRFTK